MRCRGRHNAASTPLEHLSSVATLTRRGVRTSVTEPDWRWGAVRLSSCPGEEGDVAQEVEAVDDERGAYHRQMERLSRERDRLAIRRLDLILLLEIVGLGLVTLALVANETFGFAFIDRSLDVAINSLAVLAAASLSALALARYRES